MSSAPQTLVSSPGILPAASRKAGAAARSLIFTALAAIGAYLPASAAVVFAGASTVYTNGGGSVGGGGSGPGTFTPIGPGLITSINFSSSPGPATTAITWTLQRADGTPGPMPGVGDFWFYQQAPGMGMNPGPISVTFDGIKTYTITVLTPSPTYTYPDGSAYYSYLMAARAPGGSEIPYGGRELSIQFTQQNFYLNSTVPEPASVLLSGLGLLAVFRRRR